MDGRDSGLVRSGCLRVSARPARVLLSVALEYVAAQVVHVQKLRAGEQG
jgi:hypothetical protein